MPDDTPIPYPDEEVTPTLHRLPKDLMSTATIENSTTPTTAEVSATPTFRPLLPPAVAGVVAAVAPVLMLVGGLVAPPWGPLLAVMAFIVAGLAGHHLPLPRFLAGRPMVSAALVPTFASMTPVAFSIGQALPESWRWAANGAALLLAWLAGLAAPAPSRQSA